MTNMIQPEFVYTPPIAEADLLVLCMTHLVLIQPKTKTPVQSQATVDDENTSGGA